MRQPGQQRSGGALEVALARTRGAAAQPATTADVATAAIEGKDGGTPVDAGVRAGVEPHLGVDLGGVRVHQDELARQSAAAMGARAFAHQQDVFLGPGESSTDLGLMAHELTHVAQQGAAEQPAVQRQVTVGPAGSPAEQQADAVAGRVTGGAPPDQMIVDGGQVAPGQMARNQFLAQLRPAITAAVEDALGPVWSVVGCPYIESWFARHQNTDARQLDAMARRYSGIPSPRTATEMMAPICARVAAGARRWRDGGDLSGELSAAGMPASAATAGPQGAVDAAGAAQRKPVDDAAPAAMPLERPTAEAQAAPLAAELGPGRPLESDVGSRFGDALGADLSAVRVHTGPEAARKATAEQASALTVGTDIAFAPGQYQPGTPAGDALLAHELAHTVQQKDAAAGGAQQPVAAESQAHEQDADRAAVGAMSRLYGGARDRVEPALTSGFRLQRCPGPPTVTITDPFVLGLQAKLDRGDKAGFFNDLRGLGGGRAGDAAIREGLGEFQRTGKISGAEAFRAVALQELGAERGWPEVIKNFAEGMDRGTFSVSGLAPAGADALREFCIARAGATAAGTLDLTARYRVQFDAKWEIPPYAALSSELDPALDSKGPRNRRARRIFTDLYDGDPAFKQGYDRNTPAGFRALCDTHAGPDGLNLIASPRLQELRATLMPPQLTATGTADAVYTALVAAVRPKAEALDARDRQEIDRSHEWRLAIDAKVVGPSDAVSASLRSDLWMVVTTSRSAAPAVAPTPSAPVAPEPVPTPNAAQRDFLRGITIAGPTTPVDANASAQDITFQIRSSRANPALPVRRRVVVEPSAQVVSGEEDESDWPDASAAVPHTVQVNPDSGGGASTVFTARLTMPPLPTSDFAEKTATVTVNDKRRDWFIANVGPGVTAVNENDFWNITSGGAVPFKGGQVPIRVRPGLPAANPGLTVFMDGVLRRGGAVAHTFTRVDFPAGRNSAPLFDTILTEATPPATVPEAFEAEVRFYGAAGPAFHTVVLPFQITPNMAPPPGGDAGRMARDNAVLNTPIGTPGFLDHMDKSGNPLWQRVANAVNSHALKVEACFIRSDAVTWLTTHRHDPARLTAYAMGQVTDARTLVAAPGAAGWRWGAAADTVFLNVTPREGHQRSFDEMAEFLAHEGIHAADRTEGGEWGRYTTEFRAYWVMGVGSGESTAFDPAMSGIGPKTPRARAIFNHLYGSSTYPFVKPAYDANTAGFREQVDNYLYPDGINLTLSGNLTALRTEIESYSGSGYSAKKAAVRVRFGACSAADRTEITSNRMWRDLVEEKFTGSVVTSWLPPATERKADQIKDILGIPR